MVRAWHCWIIRPRITHHNKTPRHMARGLSYALTAVQWPHNGPLFYGGTINPASRAAPLNNRPLPLATIYGATIYGMAYNCHTTYGTTTYGMRQVSPTTYATRRKPLPRIELRNPLPRIELRTPTHGPRKPLPRIDLWGQGSNLTRNLRLSHTRLGS